MIPLPRGVMHQPEDFWARFFNVLCILTHSSSLKKKFPSPLVLFLRRTPPKVVGSLLFCTAHINSSIAYNTRCGRQHV